MSASEPHIIEEISAINDEGTSLDSESDPLDDVVDIQQTSANKNNSFKLTKVCVSLRAVMSINVSIADL